MWNWIGSCKIQLEKKSAWKEMFVYYEKQNDLVVGVPAMKWWSEFKPQNPCKKSGVGKWEGEAENHPEALGPARLVFAVHEEWPWLKKKVEKVVLWPP